MSQILIFVFVLGSGWAGAEESPGKVPTASPAPVSEGASGPTKKIFIGFRLSEVDPGSVYEKAGLKIGDIVKSMNGKPIVGPDDLKQLPVILDRDKVVVVKIERDGKNITLKYRRFKKQ